LPQQKQSKAVLNYGSKAQPEV